MAVNVFYIAAAIAVLLAGGGIFWAMYHLVLTLKHVRTTVLPNMDLTLTEVQKNLNRIDELAKDVDTTVEEANQLVHTANRTVQSVENGITRFNRNVAIPTMIALASVKEGVSTAWKAYQNRETRPHAPATSSRSRVQVIEDNDSVPERGGASLGAAST